jgi:hypothetical protein
MKKIYTLPIALWLFFFTSTLVNNLSAQAPSKSEFENTLIGEFCDTFTKASPNLTKDNMTMEMGMMILPLFSKYSAQIKTEWGLDAGNKDDSRTIGERIGQLATINCPAFMTFIKTNLREIVDQQNNPGSTKTFAGKIIKAEGKPFTYLLVQNKQGRMDKFYWLEYFEGADKLQQSNGVLNKAAVITYREMEVYQAPEKEYRMIKVIIKIGF